MDSIPTDLKYTENHEWVKMSEGVITVGLTDFAQRQLNDVTFVELPEPGDRFDAEDECAVVESVKAASDIYAPLTGEVSEVNDVLDDRPELINEDPFGEGWIFRMKVDDPEQFEELLSVNEYADMLPEE
ncbi:glycine cleavage system protein GcvH [Kiritimatiella glycovorans]|uniref:glycine cleavage system protein GcvH n=1 Tax=Kiritimatiella glycovorans TaxID=1307763 RepID=UPI0006995C08|nr:glycine cleavage system protein GcvH [Kiritimatiella glycovorans]